MHEPAQSKAAICHACCVFQIMFCATATLCEVKHISCQHVHVSREVMYAGQHEVLQAVLKTAKKGSKRASSAAAAGEEGDGGTAAASDVAYEVPPDFDPALLGAPDFTSKASAEKSMAAVFLKRWWDLRDQVMLLHTVGFMSALLLLVMLFVMLLLLVMLYVMLLLLVMLLAAVAACAAC